MPTPRPSDPQDCAWAPELPGWLRGDIEPGRRLKLEDHLETCAACCAEAERLGSVLGAIAEDPGLPPHPDLAPSIVAALPEDAFRAQPTPLRLPAVFAGMAAAALLLAGLALVPGGEAGGIQAAINAPPAIIPARNAGIAWLLDQQQPDGAFLTCDDRDASRPTALALAALSGAPDREARVLRALDLAWRALVRDQTPEGRLAPPGARGDAAHALATWALGRMTAHWQWPDLGQHYLLAVQHLLNLQARDGSFPAAATSTRAAATRRALAALDLARPAGGERLERAREAARAWLSLQESAGDIRVTDLLDRQRRSGPLTGSWGGRDARLVTTCENLLALEEASSATRARR